MLKDFRKKHAKTTKSKEKPKPISAEEEERNILKKVVSPGRHKTQKDITEFWIREKAKAKQGAQESASRRRDRGESWYSQLRENNTPEVLTARREAGILKRYEDALKQKQEKENHIRQQKQEKENRKRKLDKDQEVEEENIKKAEEVYKSVYQTIFKNHEGKALMKHLGTRLIQHYPAPESVEDALEDNTEITALKYVPETKDGDVAYFKGLKARDVVKKGTRTKTRGG